MYYPKFIEKGQTIVNDISEKVSGISVGGYTDYINKIVANSGNIVSGFAENIGSTAMPSASEAFSDIKEKIADRKEKLSNITISDITDLRSDMRDLMIRFWDRGH